MNVNSFDMNEPQRGPCEECGESITTVAEECTHCGHNPGRDQYMGPGLMIFVGSILTIFIVTAIIGIPMALIGIVWAIVVWRRGENPRPVDLERSTV